MKRAAALIVIVIAVIFLLTRIDFISKVKLSGGSLLGQFSSALSGSNSGLLDELDQLRQENVSLKTMVLEKNIMKPGTVAVYSTYPFNSKKDIAIASGSLDGAREGSVVTWGDKVLIGKITSVSADSSVVSTIFDSSWEMAVRIGSSQINALFKGGTTPKVTLIPRDKEVRTGDLVLTANKDLPYGLEVGKIKDLSDTPGTPFREATLETEVQLSDLRYVTIHN